MRRARIGILAMAICYLGPSTAGAWPPAGPATASPVQILPGLHQLLQAIRQCLQDHRRDSRDVQKNYADALDACKDSAKAQIDQCGTLLPADEVACIQQAMIALQNCLQQAVVMRNAGQAAADAELQECLQALP